MTEAEKQFLKEYFATFSDAQKENYFLYTMLFLSEQEMVSYPTEEELKDGDYMKPYWAHTGEELKEDLNF